MGTNHTRLRRIIWLGRGRPYFKLYRDKAYQATSPAANAGKSLGVEEVIAKGLLSRAVAYTPRFHQRGDAGLELRATVEPRRRLHATIVTRSQLDFIHF